MTTKVTIDAHAGWPVSVTMIISEPHMKELLVVLLHMKLLQHFLLYVFVECKLMTVRKWRPSWTRIRAHSDFNSKGQGAPNKPSLSK